MFASTDGTVVNLFPFPPFDPIAPMSTAGALYLAHERQSLEVCPDDSTASTIGLYVPALAEYRWPITDCMSDASLVAWFEVCRELSATH